MNEDERIIAQQLLQFAEGARCATARSHGIVMVSDGIKEGFVAPRFGFAAREPGFEARLEAMVILACAVNTMFAGMSKDRISLVLRVDGDDIEVADAGDALRRAGVRP